MKYQQTHYDYEQLHLEEIREAADHERLIQQQPDSQNFLANALTLLLTGKQGE